ncbi:16725_t:CDS:1, partial [Racocetra persica]
SQASKSLEPAKVNVNRKNHKKIPITEFVKSLTAVTPDPDYNPVSINIMEVDTENSVGKNLAILFKNACDAEKEVTRSKQQEIFNWYYFAEAFEGRVNELIATGIANNLARTQIYEEMSPFISGITANNLRQKKT